MPLHDGPYLFIKKSWAEKYETVRSYCEGLILIKLVNLRKSADELKSQRIFIVLLLEQIVIFVSLYLQYVIELLCRIHTQFNLNQEVWKLLR